MLVEPIAKEQLISGDNVSLCEYGKIIAAGDEVKFFEVGDIIGFTIWGVKSLEIDEKKHYFIPEDDRFVLCKIAMPGGLASQV